MKSINLGDPESRSPDGALENVKRLKDLFPELVTEGAEGTAINLDVLKGLVGDKSLTDSEEKYGLNWHGKRRARHIALTPSAGTLRPAPEESLNWDTTQNLMIEGDNLEVLKLLQKSFAGRIKLIYIDPPYNTGRDFVYSDDFQNGIRNYLDITGQAEGGRKVSSNTEASGRFHTDWLNMMYPRLKIARSLLKDSGVLFASIDETEAPRLRLILEEIFGAENFVANLIWRSRTSISDDQEISQNHNHTLIFAKRRETLEFHGEPLNEAEYSNPDGDPRGPWKLVPIDANKPGGNTQYPIKNPKTGVDYLPPAGRSWAFNPEQYKRLYEDGRIKFGMSDNAAPKRKLFLKERIARGETRTPSSVLLNGGTTQEGTEECADLMGRKRVFDYPKPTSLISRIIQYGSSANEETIVLDFFAGSGTTGHATWLKNAADGKLRRFILVQLPEHLNPDTPSQRVAAEYCDMLGRPRNIAELTKERLRRAAAEVRKLYPTFTGDLGFRVFKLASSNIQTWDPEQHDLEGALLKAVDSLKPDRTELDVLYEVLLKLGLDLCVPIESRSIANRVAYAIGGGVLLVCLAEAIGRDNVEALAQGLIDWHAELAPAGATTCVFRDSAFADDVAKTNMAAILEQHGVSNVRSL